MIDQDAREYLQQLKDDPILYVTQVLGASPTEQQVEALSLIDEYEAHISIRSGHGTGK